MSVRCTLVVDDHLAMAEAIARRLAAEPDFGPAVAVRSVADALAHMGVGVFDIALIDVNLGDTDGITLCSRLAELYPMVRVIMVTCVTDLDRVVAGLRAGAWGWVPKDAPFERLYDAVREVRSGSMWLPGRVLRDVVGQLLWDRSERGRVHELLGRLSSRETEVLGALVEGLDFASIGRRLFVSDHTVRTHVQNILSKLQVHSRLAAVALVRDQLQHPPAPRNASALVR